MARTRCDYIVMIDGDMLLRDDIAVVTVHDGSPIESGEVIAPEVHAESGQKDHDCFQDPEALLALQLACRARSLA